MEEGSQVLLGVFSPALGMSSQPQGRSGLCVFSLQHVDTLFDQVCQPVSQANTEIMDPLLLSEHTHVLQRLDEAQEPALHLRPVRRGEMSQCGRCRQHLQFL